MFRAAALLLVSSLAVMVLWNVLPDGHEGRPAAAPTRASEPEASTTDAVELEPVPERAPASEVGDLDDALTSTRAPAADPAPKSARKRTRRMAVATVAGVVLDPLGAPVPKADVTLEIGDRKVIRRRTDREGRFELRVAGVRSEGREALLKASVHVWGLREDPSTSRALTLHLGERQEVELTFPEYGALDVRVVDRAGAPVPRADVRIFRPSNPSDSLASVELVEESVARVDFLPAGVLEAQVFVPSGADEDSPILGAMRREFRVEGGQSNELELTFEPPSGGEVSGRLVNRDGYGVAEKALLFCAHGLSAADGIVSAVTDTDGGFEAQVRPGRHDVFVASPTEDGSRRNLPLATLHAPTVGVVLQFPSGRVSGVVVDAEGRPVPERYVMATPLDAADVASPFFEGGPAERTDAYGRFTLGPLTRGRWAIESPAVPGQAAASEPYLHDCDGATDSSITLRVAPTGEVSVRLRGLERGHRVAIRVRGADDTAGAGGYLTRSFWYNGEGDPLAVPLPPGTYELAAVQDALVSQWSEHVRVEASRSKEVELTLSEGSFLRLELGDLAGASAVDESGRDLLRYPQRPDRNRILEWTPGVVEFGPVPPGTALLTTPAGRELSLELVAGAVATPR